MVSALHDKRDRVIAYVDYEIVDKSGNWNQQGQYCFVRHLFIHKSIKNKYTLKDFVMKEHSKFPSVKWLYYQKEKANDKRMRVFPILRFYRKKERKRGSNG